MLEVDTNARKHPHLAPQFYCRDEKAYAFVVVRGATQAEDVMLLQSVRRFEDEIGWLAREDTSLTR